MEEVIWKNIPVEELKEKYLISNNGQIKSLLTNKLLSTKNLRGGYSSIHIGNPKKSYKVHQLVAKAFISHSEDLNIVNHKDGNKLNNHVDNLEWTTIKGNNMHAHETGLQTKTKRAIDQYDLDGNIIKTFDTIRGAGVETGIDSGGIAKCCKGTRNSAGGYKWKFVDENPNEKDINLDNFIEVNNFKNYLINNKGQIYSKPYKKLLKFQKNGDGHFCITLNNKGNRQFYLLHRLLAEHFVPNDNPELKKRVIHIDKNITNNEISNLQWVI